MSDKNYAQRDACELDEAGGYYWRHVSAMTSESLHAKSAIAGELGYRDMLIDQLRRRIAKIEEERDRSRRSCAEAYDLLQQARCIEERPEHMQAMKELQAEAQRMGLYD